MNFLLTNYVYDSNNKLISSSSYFWEDDEWKKRNKFSFTYDDNGNQILSVRESWRDSYWVFSERISRVFDNNRNLVQEVRENYDSYFHKWNGVERNTFTYNSNKNISSQLKERYYNDQWNYFDRYTYSEDRGIYLYQKYENNIWLNSLQKKYGFDSLGRETSIVWQDWKNGQWANTRYYTWFYNDEEKTSTHTYYVWKMKLGIYMKFILIVIMKEVN